MAEDEDLQLLRATRPYLGVRNLFALVWLLELHERPEDAALPRPTTRAPNLASSMLRRAADEFANPTRGNRLVSVAFSSTCTSDCADGGVEFAG